MKVYKEGVTPDPKRFGGTLPLEAEIDEAMLAEVPGLALVLDVLGRSLVAQNKLPKRSTGEERTIIGVNILSINFAFIIE